MDTDYYMTLHTHMFKRIMMLIQVFKCIYITISLRARVNRARRISYNINSSNSSTSNNSNSCNSCSSKTLFKS